MKQRQEQLFDALLAGRVSGFLEIPQNGMFELTEKIPRTLPSLPLGKRAGRRSIRSEQEIKLAILDSCRVPMVQHWIMVKARLGYDTFWKHMNELLSAGVMEETIDGSKTLYHVNAKGLKILSERPIQ
jgi:predicted transcriptional regulator